MSKLNTDQSNSEQTIAKRVQLIENLLGRPLRVLHIGNIANNAYIISKLLSECGVQSHVLCYDYYHIMGTPEWEDASFDSANIDHFAPNWRSINLGDFRRPAWFTQGPLELCLEYLSALQQSDQSEMARLQRQLASFNRTSPVPPPGTTPLQLVLSSIRQWRIEFGHLCTHRSVKTTFVNRFLKEKKRPVLNYLKAVVALPFFGIALLLKRAPIARFLPSFFNQGFSSGFFEVAPPPLELQDLLCKSFKSAFPTRSDSLTIADFSSYRRLPTKTRSVLDYYDVIHAYATDPIIPMLVDKKNYVAYEHGTIRNLPFEDKPISRLTALAYRNARAVICTNADCLPAAQLLAGTPQQIIKGLHGFDERNALKRVEQTSMQRTPKEARFNIPHDIAVFIHPARQDWGVKGNDRLFEALCLLKRRRHELKRPFVVVLSEWGNDVGKAKKFIDCNRIDELILWTDVLSKSELLHSVAFVDGIIDQFLIPCIGAVPPELLTVSAGPLITHLNEEVMCNFYGENLPVLNAQSPTQIADQMLSVINSTPEATSSRDHCKNWVRALHSHIQVTSKCLDAYEIALNMTSSEGQQ